MAATVSKRTLLIGIGLLGLAARSVVADFTPPANGKITEKQMTDYIAVRKDQIAAAKDAEASIKTVTSDAAKMAIAAQMSKKMEGAAGDHGMSKEEFEWVDQTVSKCWTIAFWKQQWVEKGKPGMEGDIKSQGDLKTAAIAEQAVYEKAAKDNVRVMTKDERDSAVQSATSDRDTAAAELKDAKANVQSIQDEAAGRDKEAADAEKLAKNPPADVGADDRAGYVDGKKTDAQSAKDAAKSSRDRLPDAQKVVDEAQAKVTAATARIAHPEIPVTDDDKAAVKEANAKGIEAAKAKIDTADTTIKTLNDQLAAGSPMLAGVSKDEMDKIDPDNLALVQKHIHEYLSAIGLEKMFDQK